MRKYHHIDLTERTIRTEELHGEAIARAGRYLIAKTLVELGVAGVDPLGPENPLIFSAGPFAGSSFSNANRTSVGCKSPLTGGIKEANGGGTFGYAMGQLEIAGFNLYGACQDWVILHLKKDGDIEFDDASPYLGKGNFEVAKMLHAAYGKKVSLGICGPVGEYQGLLAGISFSDNERRPSRLAARGGVGAVMGSKRVKAIVVDLDRMPGFHERKKVVGDIRHYAKILLEDEIVTDNYGKLGTMSMADYTNYIGGLPVRNFTSGQLADGEQETFKMGAEFIRPQNIDRGGEHTHACMPGCVIQCSNIYADAEGNEIVSPVEYETLGILGANCGIKEPDQLAVLNAVANDLGIDTIETGAMIGVLLDVGVAEFGDAAFILEVLDEIRRGTENGRLWAQGTARVGEHYGHKRVPVIKKQGISAYDPRVIEITGISMMTTAQGADHTTGNVPRYKSRQKGVQELMELSLDAQVTSAAQDSLGLCIFGRSVNNTNQQFLVEAINSAHGTDLGPDFYEQLGSETLLLEREFNRQAGFTVEDDELPEFFYSEPLPPSNQAARFHAAEVHDIFDRLGSMPG